jgi:hypothetical protein
MTAIVRRPFELRGSFQCKLLSPERLSLHQRSPLLCSVQHPYVLSIITRDVCNNSGNCICTQEAKALLAQTVLRARFTLAPHFAIV